MPTPQGGGAQAKSGGALFKKFSGASRRKRCAPSLLKPFRRLCAHGQICTQFATDKGQSSIGRPIINGDTYFGYRFYEGQNLPFPIEEVPSTLLAALPRTHAMKLIPRPVISHATLTAPSTECCYDDIVLSRMTYWLSKLLKLLKEC